MPPSEGEMISTSGAPSGTNPGLPAGVSKEQLAIFAAQAPSMLPQPSILVSPVLSRPVPSALFGQDEPPMILKVLAGTSSFSPECQLLAEELHKSGSKFGSMLCQL